MSFNIFFQTFESGVVSTFPRALLESAVAPYIAHREAGCLVLSFGDAGEPEIYVDDAENVESFMVAHPPVAPIFWDMMFGLLQQTAGVLFWPGGGCVVANARAAAELPADMVEALGPPIVIGDGARIADLISAS